jgi:hypothetical protein
MAARDKNTGIDTKPTTIADEQTKAAGAKASVAKATPVVSALEAQATTLLSKLQSQLADAYISQGLNPDGTKKSNTQLLREKQAATAAAREAEVAANPLKNKSIKPSAPAGFKYTWIGGTDTGQWQLYKTSDVVSGNGGGGGGNGANGGGSSTLSTTTDTVSNTPTTNIEVLKALLKGQGFNSSLIDSSATYLQKLLKDNIDYDNAVEIFLNAKDYTFKDGSKATSPFYTEYGYLNEGLVNPKSAREIYSAVEGYKGVVDTYKLSSKYLSKESLQGYVKNNVTVTDLAERANTAKIRALEADTFQVNALVKLGYIGSAADLADFYLDSKIGKEQLEINRQTGVFTAEALRREKAGVVTSDAQLQGFKQLTATLAAKGYSEGQISQLAATGFENIAQTLDPLAKYAGIYEKVGGTVESNAAVKSSLQSELLQEEFQGTASERRKRISEQNLRAFQGAAGTTTSSLKTSGASTLL